MKTLVVIIFASLLIITGSFAQETRKDKYGDDVYFTPAKKAKKAGKKASDAGKPEKDSLQVKSGLPVVVEPDSTAAVTAKSAATYDDYNDYSYAARVKRFHDPEPNSSYFDEQYTESSTYDTVYSTNSPESNVNVYIGAGIGSCWGPSFSFGYGWGYDPWYWNFSWGYPYWGWYWGFNYWWYYPYFYYPYYWSPYAWGYWNGYWDGYYGYPYGWSSCDYPCYNTYYGRRRPLASPGGEHLTQRDFSSDRSVTSINQQNQHGDISAQDNKTLMRSQEITSSKITSQTADQSKRNTPVPSTQQKYQFSRTSGNDQRPIPRTTSEIAQHRQSPVPKYSKPGNDQLRNGSTPGRTQNYTSPTYRQPKSSQEYLNPRVQPVSNQPIRSSTRQNVAPQPGTQRQTAPTLHQPSTLPSGTPSRINSDSKNYNGPTRTSHSPGFTPSRSTNSFSSPSRSNSNSYSSPARSGSGSFSSPSRSSGGNSGSSGGFGGRRK